MADYQSILSAASQLPISEQLRLIDDLASRVPDNQPPSLSQNWLKEITRRSDEIESGAVETESWSDIRSRLFKKHGIDGEN